MSEKEQQQPQEEQQRQDSVQSDAFDDDDDDYGDDPDDFVANQKPSGNKGGTNHTKNKQGSVYSSKHSRIKQAQRESRNTCTTKPNHHQAPPSTKKWLRLECRRGHGRHAQTNAYFATTSAEEWTREVVEKTLWLTCFIVCVYIINEPRFPDWKIRARVPFFYLEDKSSKPLEMLDC